MRIPALLATLLLLASIGTYAGITYYSKQEKVEEPKVEILTAAPTTETASEEKPAEPTKPEKVYITIPQKTEPKVEINNGVKNESVGTVNVYNTNSQQTTTANTQEQPQPTSSTQAPAPNQTPLEKALAIVHSWDVNGTAEYYGDNKIRVFAFNGKSLTVDLVGDWETTLNINLRKIK